MELQRETVTEIAVSTITVLLFIAVVFFIGIEYRTNGTISETGSIAVLVSIAGFVLAMAGVGYYLAVTTND
jgi:hypothetical protein